MREIVRIIEELRLHNGTNDKINILKANSENELLKKVLYYTYNSNLNFGISEKTILKEYPYYTPKYCKVWDNLFDMLDELSVSNINDKLKNDVFEFLYLIDNTDELDLVVKIITKDLRINMGVKNINKAIPKLIPEFAIQQGYQISKYKWKKNEWFALEEKLNGINCSYVNGDMISRQGKKIEGLNHIIEQLNQLECVKGNYYFNGELVRKNVDNISNGENFRLTTSIVNSDNDKSEIDFIVFDLLPIEEFYEGKSKLKYKDRLELLKELDKESKAKGLNNLSIPIIYYEGNDTSAIDTYLQQATIEDKEGLMALRNVEWKNKRHNGCLKIKQFNEIDLEVIDCIEGEGRLQGTLGALVVKFYDSTVNVGSGYDDDTRQMLWRMRDKLKGRVISVKYKEITEDKKTKLKSLQFPVFLELKEEGKKVNYN